MTLGQRYVRLTTACGQALSHKSILLRQCSGANSRLPYPPRMTSATFAAMPATLCTTARLFIHTNVGLHAEVMLVAFLGLVHFRVAFTVLVLGGVRRINQRRIYDDALAQGQASVALIAINDGQNSGSQFVFLLQPTEVGNRGFVRNALQIQPSKLAQNGGVIQRLFHFRIAVAEPVSHQMNRQHRHHRIERTTAFTLRVIQFNQGSKAVPRQHPSHLDQEQLISALLALIRALGVGHLLHQTLSGWSSGILQKLKVFFSTLKIPTSKKQYEVAHVFLGKIQLIAT